MADAAPPRRILVYSMQELIGDGVMKLPFIAGLRAAFPGARIAWGSGYGKTVYATDLAPVVAGMIDEVLLGDAAIAAEGRGAFDLVIDTQSRLQRSWPLRRAGGRFISPTWGYLLSDAGPKLARKPASMMERLLTILQAAAGPTAGFRRVTLADPRATAAAKALLPAGAVYVGLAPGAGGREKRWPMERYVALAEAQRARGRKPVFFMGPAEADEVAPLRAACPGALLPQFDRTDGFTDIDGPLLVIALAERLAGAVANDAGPGHMLAAGGAPLVSLQQDRRKAVKFRPAAERLTVLVAEDFAGDGMAALPLDTVVAAVEAMVGGGVLSAR